MNVEYRTTSIFGIQAQAYVNPVNCIGISGSGLTLQFKKAYPENFDAYEAICKSPGMQPGNIFPFAIEALWPKHIVNFATKDHWKNPSRAVWIKDGMNSLMLWVSQNKIESIAIPMLGCGLGGLDFEKDVKTIYEATFKVYDPLDVQVSVLI